MVDLAKQLNNDPKMIQLSQIFVQQPRDSLDGSSVPYCQESPKNQELNGFFQCQFESLDPKTFTGKVPLGQPGTMPQGQSSPMSPAGSCPASPQAPVPDGMQLVAMTQDPGAPLLVSGNSTNNTNSSNGSDNNNNNNSTDNASSNFPFSFANPFDNNSNNSSDSSDSFSASASPSDSPFSFGSPTSSDGSSQTDSASSTSSVSPIASYELEAET
jgi:hypothetical protein